MSVPGCEIWDTLYCMAYACLLPGSNKAIIVYYRASDLELISSNPLSLNLFIRDQIYNYICNCTSLGLATVALRVSISSLLRQFDFR